MGALRKGPITLMADTLVPDSVKSVEGVSAFEDLDDSLLEGPVTTHHGVEPDHLQPATPESSAPAEAAGESKPEPDEIQSSVPGPGLPSGAIDRQLDVWTPVATSQVIMSAAALIGIVVAASLYGHVPVQVMLATGLLATSSAFLSFRILERRHLRDMALRGAHLSMTEPYVTSLVQSTQESIRDATLGELEKVRVFFESLLEKHVFRVHRDLRESEEEKEQLKVEVEILRRQTSIAPAQDSDSDEQLESNADGIRASADPALEQALHESAPSPSPEPATSADGEQPIEQQQWSGPPNITDVVIRDLLKSVAEDVDNHPSLHGTRVWTRVPKTLSTFATDADRVRAALEQIVVIVAESSKGGITIGAKKKSGSLQFKVRGKNATSQQIAGEHRAQLAHVGATLSQLGAKLDHRSQDTGGFVFALELPDRS